MTRRHPIASGLPAADPTPNPRPSAGTGVRTGASLSLCAGLGLALACTLARAESTTRPLAGLWEQSVQVSSPSGRIEAALQQAQALLAGLPPEQRRMLEQRLAQQGLALGAGGQSLRICLTAEDVARDELPPARDGCSQTSLRQGNTWAVSLQCPARSREPATSGRGTITLQSPTAYSGQFTLNALRNTASGPQAEALNLATQGRWLAADCGSVQPVRR